MSPTPLLDKKLTVQWHSALVSARRALWLFVRRRSLARPERPTATRPPLGVSPVSLLHRLTTVIKEREVRRKTGSKLPRSRPPPMDNLCWATSALPAF